MSLLSSNIHEPLQMITWAKLTESLFVREFEAGWPVLLTGFLCLLFAFSAPAFVMPFLYPEVINEFGWTRQEATLLATAKYLTGAIAAVVVGRFVDIVGARWGLIIVSSLGGLAMISFLWTPDLFWYYAAGVLLGIAGPGTMVTVKVMVSRTFHATQGTAMGAAMLGPAAGSFLVPLLAAYLIKEYDWRIAMALMSLGIWFIAIPLLLFYWRGGESADPRAKGQDWKKLGDLMRGRGFWLVGLAVFLAAFVDQAYVQHTVLYLQEDLGISPMTVAGAVGTIGLIGIGGRVLVGAVFDKWSNRGVSAMYLVLSAACLLALAALNPWIFAAFIVFRAVGHAAVLLDTTVLAKHVFGMQHLGVLLGIFTAIVNLGFATGPWFMATLYEMTGSYVSPFLICCVIAIFAAGVLIPVRPSYWLSMKSDRSVAAPATS